MASAKERECNLNIAPQRLRKANGQFVVTIPEDEITRQGIKEGDFVFVTIRAADVRPHLSPRLGAMLDESLAENADVYRHLAGR